MGNGLNGFVSSMFAGYKEAKKDNLDKEFDDLNWSMDCWIGTTNTGLYDVADLRELLNKAQTKEHYEAILEHMYRHDATRVGYYKNIENQIIDKMWEE